jgi:hypothetical protein
MAVSSTTATYTWRHSSGRGQPELECGVCGIGQQASLSSSSLREATHAANSGHLDVARAPRSAIEPRELNWVPARDSSVVVAGIVSGCAEFSGGGERSGRRRDLMRAWCGLPMDSERGHARAQGGQSSRWMGVLTLNRKV